MIMQWILAHHKFHLNRLYIAGDSYSGITVPALVKKFLMVNKDQLYDFLSIVTRSFIYVLLNLHLFFCLFFSWILVGQQIGSTPKINLGVYIYLLLSKLLIYVKCTQNFFSFVFEISELHRCQIERSPFEWLLYSLPKTWSQIGLSLLYKSTPWILFKISNFLSLRVQMNILYKLGAYIYKYIVCIYGVRVKSVTVIQWHKL